jgi:hypothetical protein
VNQRESGRIRTLDLKPRNEREARKPAELIQISGHHELTLNARRAITILWHHAHMQGVMAGKDYTIEIDNLKADRHKARSNERAFGYAQGDKPGTLGSCREGVGFKPERPQSVLVFRHALFSSPNIVAGEVYVLPT